MFALLLLTSMCACQERDQLFQRLARENDEDCIAWIAERLHLRLQPADFSKLLPAIDEAPPAARPGLIQILPKFGDPGKEALRKLVSKHDLPSRAAAARALADMGTGEGIDALLRARDAAQRPEEERLLVLSLLDRPWPGVSLAPARGWIAASEPALIRRGAMAAAAVFGDAAMLDEIEARAGDESDPLRYAALGALLAAGRETHIRRAQEDLLADKLPLEAWEDVLWGLAACRWDSAAQAVATLLKTEKDAGRKARLVRAVPRFVCGRLPMYIDLLAADGEAQVRAAAEEAALGAADRVSPGTLKKLLAHKDAGRRLGAAEALLLRDDTAALATVEEALKGRDPAARRIAWRVLSRLRLRAGVDLAFAGLTDAEAGVRCLAERALSTTLTAQFPYRVFDTAMTGYSPLLGSDDARAKGTQRLRDWWKANEGSARGKKR